MALTISLVESRGMVWTMFMSSYGPPCNNIILIPFMHCFLCYLWCLPAGVVWEIGDLFLFYNVDICGAYISQCSKWYNLLNFKDLVQETLVSTYINCWKIWNHCNLIPNFISGNRNKIWSYQTLFIGIKSDHISLIRLFK